MRPIPKFIDVDSS